MNEATSSPVHTLHGAYTDNFNLRSACQAAIPVGPTVQFNSAVTVGRCTTAVLFSLMQQPNNNNTAVSSHVLH